MLWLADLVRDLESVFDELGLMVAIYGDAGSGKLDLQRLFDRNAPDLPALLTRLADRLHETVFRYNSTITSEHSMGRLRAPYLTQ
jgi:FAD/FMN-containing dehydrogenase